MQSTRVIKTCGTFDNTFANKMDGTNWMGGYFFLLGRRKFYAILGCCRAAFGSLKTEMCSSSIFFVFFHQYWMGIFMREKRRI